MPKRWFLFQARPEADWDRTRRLGLWSYHIALYLLACLGLSALSLVLSVGPYPLSICKGFLRSPLLILLNTLPVLGVGLLFYGLLGRAAWSYALTALLVVGGSVGNYFKLAFRDDPVMFGDLLLLREAGNMATKYQPYWDRTMIMTAVCVVLGLAVLLFLARGRPQWKLRLGLALSGLALLGIMLPLALNDDLYNKTAQYDLLENRWSATQQYIAHGFLYPFFHSINDTVEFAPDGYDQTEAQALLDQYTDQDIPESQKVNVIGIMFEAYNDFTKFGVPELSSDVYAVWHQLESEGYSGNLVTNIFAGGTVDTERSFLTGFSSAHSYRSQTNSYVWYFRQQGYTVEGMHPSMNWFYNRRNINENLGFSNYYFMENYFSDLTEWPTAGDSIFFPELLKKYQAATESGTPYFNFSVTYQGHGPYYDSEFYWGDPADYVVNDGSYSQEEYYIMANYFASIADTNQYLGEFTDYLRQDDTPVVLVLFGDHNPWMGDGNSVYNALGIDFNLDTQEGFLNYYSTRYIIWANDAAKEILGNDFQGTGPDISPCFLMNELFSLCGWDGPAYMQAASAVAAQVPVIHTTGRYMEDGTITTTLTQAHQTLVDNFESVQYLWQTNFAYGKE